LYEYIESRDVPRKADYNLDQTEKVFSNLSEHPGRGACPKKPVAIGLREYREVFFNPYRIICRTMDDKVYVMVIADGRSDMQALLQRRLLQV